MQLLAITLDKYTTFVDYWDADAGDTFLMFGYRKWVEERRDGLSESQLELLEKYDAKVLDFAAQQYVEETDDVQEIRLIADLIKHPSKYIDSKQ